MPPEVRLIIGLIALEVLFFSWIGLTSETASMETVLGSVLVDIALIIDLIRRTPRAWRVAMLLSVPSSPPF